MPIHVRVLRTHFPHWGAYSGINQFLNYLDRSKYSVAMHVVSDSDEDFPIQNIKIRNWCREVIRKQGMEWYKLSDLAAEVNALTRLWRRKIDIVHYLDGEHSALFLPKLLNSFGTFRPKLVATYHQPCDVLESLVNRNVVAKLDCVTVVSPDQLPFFVNLLPPERVRLILHGIDTGHFRPADGCDNGNTFTCVTTGHYLRDFQVVRQVAEQLKAYRDIAFHVVTGKRTGLEDLPNVTIHREHLHDEALLRLYQRSQVLFLPLIQSTANNSLLEGLACGLPIISTALPSVKVYAPGNEAVLIKDNDPEQFVDTILHLFRHPDERGMMAQAARKRAEELDWSKIAPQYDALYSAVRSA
jgi:glycosyltransferase involved in cell wall biosynthesis